MLVEYTCQEQVEQGTHWSASECKGSSNTGAVVLKMHHTYGTGSCTKAVIKHFFFL
jgi:hypothetical protein